MVTPVGVSRTNDMRCLLCTLFITTALSAAPGAQTFTGTVTDDMCANADHSAMRMGPTDAECAAACVDTHGAAWLLFDGKNAYTLNGKAAEKFAGQKVRVVGTLDARTKTITITSIDASK